MDSITLTQIEDSFSRLPRPEQLLLPERLVHHLNETEVNTQRQSEMELTAMAADPEIQRELQKIEAEFALADSDGLETV